MARELGTGPCFSPGDRGGKRTRDAGGLGFGVGWGFFTSRLCIPLLAKQNNLSPSFSLNQTPQHTERNIPPALPQKERQKPLQPAKKHRGFMEGLISPPPAPPQLQEEEKQSQPGHHGEAGWQQPLGTFPVLPGERAPSPQSSIPTQLLPRVATARPHNPLTPKETWTAMGGWVWAVPMPQPAALPVGVWARFPQQHLHSTLRCPGFPGSLGEHRPTGKGHSRTSVPTWPDSSKLKCRGIWEKKP